MAKMTEEDLRLLTAISKRLDLLIEVQDEIKEALLILQKIIKSTP